jgi:hypothetical protein
MPEAQSKKAAPHKAKLNPQKHSIFFSRILSPSLGVHEKSRFP